MNKKWGTPFCILSNILITFSSSGIKLQTLTFPLDVRIPTPELTSVAKSSTFCMSDAVITDEE